jgi:hypothetical protein
VASPLDLPRRVAASVGSSIDAAGELPVFQQKVLDHLGSMDRGTQDLVSLMGPMRQDIELLVARASELERSTARIELKLDELRERLPDPDAPGPLAKARDAITGEQ